VLESPNTYYYSLYQGQEFLSAWREQRINAQSDLKARIGSAGSIGVGTDSATDRMLDALCRNIAMGRVAEESEAVLNSLVQRFEVTKRLHGEYNAKFRPVDRTDYRSLERYVRFAETLDLAYTSAHKLPYLNALLKCLDILTALSGRLDTAQGKRVQQLIDREREHVQRLAEGLSRDVHAS
jgi:hypothetical protein